MRALVFSGRVSREILRDPLTAVFGIGFPVILLLLLSAIQASIPVSLFEIDSLTPGIAVFGLSFMTLFSALLISKDRSGAFFERLLTTPMRAHDFIIGYTLPLIPIAVAQSTVCYITAIILGLEVSLKIPLAILSLLPTALFFIALGLLFGTLLNDKQVGGIAGAVVTNVSALLSGAWFDLKLVGGAFEKIAFILPFANATEIGRSILMGGDAGLSWLNVSIWAVFTLFVAIFVFIHKK